MSPAGRPLCASARVAGLDCTARCPPVPGIGYTERPGAPLLLVTVTLLAGYLPADRAARVEQRTAPQRLK
jgi:hypothetical protein